MTDQEFMENALFTWSLLGEPRNQAEQFIWRQAGELVSRLSVDMALLDQSFHARRAEVDASCLITYRLAVETYRMASTS